MLMVRTSLNPRPTACVSDALANSTVCLVGKSAYNTVISNP